MQQKSRDFYWYCPVLKRELDHVTADLVVSPKNEAEVIRVLAACHRHGVPVTPRGTGTGNYGQAMPLSGGVVLTLPSMNAVTSIAPGPRRRRARARCSPTSTERRARIPARNCACTLDLQHGLDRRLHRRRLGRRRLDQLGRPARPRQRPPAARRHHGGGAAGARADRRGPARRSSTPTAPTASSPKSRCR